MSYAKGVYKDLGIDVEGLQYHYLFATGGKMIALALLGMAASILVCYLAARVGARSGTRYQRKCVPKGGRIFQQ